MGGDATTQSPLRGRASGMREEHLKRWMATARKSEKVEKAAKTTERRGMKDNSGTLATQSETEVDNWTMVVDLFQLTFQEGKLVKEATWQAVVLIPKGKRTTGELASWR